MRSIMKKIDFEKYQQFVNGVTSSCSQDFNSFMERLKELAEENNPNRTNIERLLTAGVGINAEGGEFLEIIKKIIFQGKEYTEANREHLIIELGDIMWYVAQACMAMDISFDDVIARNVEKLRSRYPGGEFDVYYSENRKEGDL